MIMISYLLGIISVFLFRYIVAPKPVVVYGNEALEFIRGDDMSSSQFSMCVDDVRLAWNVEKLWVEFESLEPVEWKIPDSFKEEWNWGQSHPSNHLERCLNADLSYPILVWDDTIIDGCHRTIKALAKNQKTIKARVIINMPPPDEETELDPVEDSTDIPWTNGDMVQIVQAVMEYEMMKEYEYRHPLDGV